MSAVSTPAAARVPPPPAIDYPESDGEPMADNTRQFRWIQTIHGNLAGMYHAREDVVVIGNSFWYPEEGFPKVVAAPDVFVVFGRPKMERPSYKQWEEGGVAPQVVFEILSPKNTYVEMQAKLDFYEDHGAEEYYVFDPETNALEAYTREGSILRRRRPADGFVSPLLKIRFDLSGPEMVVYHPDGQPFLTFEELTVQRERERRGRLDAESRASSASERAARLAELSLKLLAGTAGDEERAELARLAGDQAP